MSSSTCTGVFTLVFEVMAGAAGSCDDIALAPDVLKKVEAFRTKQIDDVRAWIWQAVIGSDTLAIAVASFIERGAKLADGDQLPRCYNRMKRIPFKLWLSICMELGCEKSWLINLPDYKTEVDV